jgi:predicted dinucleotide-binding enzyme
LRVYAGRDAKGQIPLARLEVEHDPDAKQLITGLCNQFGFDALDIGGLAESWRVDPGPPAFVIRQDVEQLKANVAAATCTT